ncbi:MAG: hypothetical protein HQK49_09235 [Oligoflexia bacterium]|nr:hypothetical protein [Oligoflexia bacterium]
MIFNEISSSVKNIFLSSFDKNDPINYPKAVTLLVCYLIIIFSEILSVIGFLIYDINFFKMLNIQFIYVTVTTFSIISIISLYKGKLNVTINLTALLLSFIVIGGLLTKLTAETSINYPLSALYATAGISLVSIFGTKNQLKFMTANYMLALVVYFFYMKNTFPPYYLLSAKLIVIMSIIILLIVSTISYSFIDIRERSLEKIMKQTEHNNKLYNELNTIVNQRAKELDIVKNKFATVNNEINLADKNINKVLTKNNEYGLKSQEIVKSMLTKTDDGKQIMNEMIDAFKTIKTSNSQLNDINNIFMSIVSRISIIYDIAFETKILSFNAAIEAARAGGVAGLGFAVVADEVGNLAKKSGDAATEIAEIIEKSKRQVGEIIENISKQSYHVENIGTNSKNKYVQLAQDIDQLCHQVNLIKQNNEDHEKIIRNHFASMKIK